LKPTKQNPIINTMDLVLTNNYLFKGVGLGYGRQSYIVILMEENEVPRENHQPVESQWRTLSQNVV
jgi:hypothetical protein